MYLDRGIWVLYVAFRTVNWLDDGGDKRRSPLVLIPVQLRSNGPRQTHTLIKSDEDLVVNPALCLKYSQYDMTMPTTQQVNACSESGGVGAALQLTRGLAPERDWLIDDHCTLATFMFAKEAMYGDLGENQDRVLSQTVIGARQRRAGHPRPAQRS